MKIFYWIILFVLAINLNAQEQQDLGKVLFNFGASYSNNGQINKLISSEDFVALSDWTYDAGLSYWIPFGRWSLIVDLHGANQSQNGSNGYVSKQQFLRGGGSLGYDILKSRKWSIIPYVGFSAEHRSLEFISGENTSSGTLPEVLSEAPTAYVFEIDNVLTQSGLYLMSEIPMGKINLTLGLQLGYSVRAAGSQWQTGGGREIEGMDTPNSFTTNAVVGFSF